MSPLLIYAFLLLTSAFQINGTKIPKGGTGFLREGNEIAFGTSVPQPQNGGIEDYREYCNVGCTTTGLTMRQDSSTAT